jgi:pimeloyl-ACP methyl ester carboxylesterase
MLNIIVNHLQVHFEEAGSGDAIVLLHGLGSCGQDWLLQVPVFAERFHVITPDLRGHGQTDKPQGGVRVSDLVGDVIGLLDVLDVDRAHIVGLSLGGCVAQELALDVPSRVRSLTLANTFAHLSSDSPRHALMLASRLAVLGLWGLPAQAHFVAARLFPKPEQAGLRKLAAERIAANEPATYRRLLLAIRAFDVRDRLREIKCPTLVIAGDRDTTVPMKAKQLVASLIPGARLEIVADSGHATPIDQPEVFNRLVLNFVESVS